MHAMPEREGRVGSVSRCRWCAATATFAGSECVVCAREGQRRLKSHVLIILRIMPAHWVSLRPCTTLSQHWLALQVLAPLNPVLMVWHRFKKA